jgi:hypothetical protein
MVKAIRLLSAFVLAGAATAQGTLTYGITTVLHPSGGGCASAIPGEGNPLPGSFTPLPTVGQTFQCAWNTTPSTPHPAQFGFLMFWAGAPNNFVELPLGPDMPGCVLQAPGTFDLLARCTVHSLGIGGSHYLEVIIPTELLGSAVFLQFGCLSPGSNPAGVRLAPTVRVWPGSTVYGAGQ